MTSILARTYKTTARKVQNISRNNTYEIGTEWDTSKSTMVFFSLTSGIETGKWETHLEIREWDHLLQWREGCS